MQRAVALSCAIYEALASAKDYGFKDQVTRSALSLVSNIADKNAGAIFEQL